MNEKYKKAVYSVIYRFVICILLFVAAFAASRFFPAQWSCIHNMLEYNADFNRAGNFLKQFFTEILPVSGG